MGVISSKPLRTNGAVSMRRTMELFLPFLEVGLTMKMGPTKGV